MAKDFQTDRATRILKRFDTATAERGSFETTWDKIAKRILPQYAGSFQRGGETNQGEVQTNEMVDASGALALPKFAAALESMLTPRNSRWHKLDPVDPVLKRSRVAKLWYDDVTTILFRYRNAAMSGFSTQQHECYLGLGAFGTGAKYIDRLDKRWGGGLRYRAIHLGEVYFLENHQGIVDTAFHRYERTARQAGQEFGEDNLPDEIRNLLTDVDKSKAEKKFWFVRCVEPRSEAEGYDPKRLDYKGMQYASCTVSETGKAIVQEKGYHKFPYAISRYVVAPGETYGRSPAMMVLPSLLTLNEQKRTVLKQGHRTVDPVLLAYDDGVLDGFSLRPGSINPGGVSADGKQLVHALPVGNLALAKEMMDEERAIINDAFLVTLFQILTDQPQMTATEVIERAREKGVLLSPTVGRQETEDLGPTIERELDVLASQGLLPPMPPIVAQARGEYQPVYENPLSRAQRAEQAAGIMRTIDWVLPYVQATNDPSPLDHIDMDAAMPEVLDIQGSPTRWTRSAEAVEAIRQGRAQAQQTQQALDAAPAAAGLMKAMPQGAA